MKEKVESFPQDPAFEYAFERVPEDKRKNLLSLTVVLAGFPIALSNFIIGGMVASQLPFAKAMLALIVGNLVLMAVVIFMGMLASKEGLSSTFLSRNAFGKIGSYIFSVLLFLSALTWISMNGDIFSRLVNSLFSWWPIPIPLTAAIVVFLWLLSAMRGYKGLALMSNIGVPAAILLSIFGVVFVAFSEGGLSNVVNYVPETSLTFTAATAAIVGGWIYGATITADVTRFAKRKTHVVIAGIIAFSIGCLGFQIAGAIVAISTGETDFIQAMIQSGLGFVAFITAVFCLWTTEDKEIYTGSLALQNIIKETKLHGKVKHKHTATIVATAAAIFAAGGIFAYIMPIIQFLSILIPPIPGIIIAEGFFIKKSKNESWINKTALFAWIIGGVLSYISLKTNFFISPLVGLLSAGIFYILFEKIKNNNSSSVIVTEDKVG
ncbi:thiamine permease [Siminovitchia terrae]|uniref:Thiamine permease n=1 Tax=Siminovitchia terrae TaxID=1914933 RepID=A0A429X1K9_SIMTE|nr:cytosine permease [Siminovitchia terrae]RST57297.1 thiamine permease [Siminovitchia terrae]